MEIQQEKEHKSAHVFLDLHYFHLLEKEKQNWTKCEKHEKKNQQARNMERKKIRLAAMWKLKNANDMELVSII